MAFHALFQNIPKRFNRIYVWVSRWPIYDRKVRGILIQPASSQLGEKYSCLAGKLHYRADNRTAKTDVGDHPSTLHTELHRGRLVHEPKVPKSATKTLQTIFSASRRLLSSRNRDSSPHATRFQSSTLQSVLSCPGKTCSLMASIEPWYSRRSTAPDTHTVKLELPTPFADCTTGIVIQLGGNLSCLALLATYNTPEWSLATHCQG
ncbi:hypothetical protein TNCV_109161 [Trichonephila clavipes]|nr:hypothetical protein TNCV_109161 [Trichonephila clavipes]